MTTRTRDKNVWFIPKRANIHQMVALLHGIIVRNYDGTTWNASKQDNLNLELKKLGATQSGEKIAPQGMRTLLASVHYLGFVYLDTTTTPTTLRVTEAGYDFYHAHVNELVKMEKLNDELTITKSNLVLSQLSKLQITNPIILPFCEDIYVFPFRVALQIMSKIDYLDLEEIAMFVFHTRNMSEVEYVVQQILNFRKMEKELRERQVSLYKETSIGNLTLKKAPSAGYFMALCVGTGIINRNPIITNSGKKVSAISIKSDKKQWVIDLLDFHKNTETFDFEDNLKLWIDYYGQPRRCFPPTLMNIKNEVDNEFFIEILDNNDNLIDTVIINAFEEFSVPVFEKEEYKISIYSINGGNLLNSRTLIATKKQKYVINMALIGVQSAEDDNLFNSYSTLGLEEVINEILEHSDSNHFSRKMIIKLKLLKEKLGIDKITDKSLRGAQYEYLFYLLLSLLKENELVDEVIWNGKIGKYNLPTQAPGGKKGTPDIIFIIDGIRYVLELTTIKAKSTQFVAEGSSVPDHIKLYQEEFPYAEVRGIFCAPFVHDRVHATMKSILVDQNIPFISISDKEILDIFKSRSKMELIKELENLFNSSSK